MIVNSGNGELKFCREILTANGTIGHFDKIETGTVCPGRPDLDYCMYGVQGQIELKHLDRLRLRPDTVKANQVKWFEKRMENKGFPLIFTKVEISKFAPCYLLFPGSMIRDLYHTRDADLWIEMAPFSWGPTMDWMDFRFHLMNPKGVYHGRQYCVSNY